MLAQLSIKNYALIDDISVSFSDGFTTITGETGAGKSILLGGLSLVLGKRADLSSLRDMEKKCVIEAEFDIRNYKLQSFFKKNDLEYEARTIIRREIYPSGKSRAFINDSPVTLDVLSQFGKNLIDVHSQHQTLQLAEQDFQMHVIDALGSNKTLLGEYRIKLETSQLLQKELTELLEQQRNSIKDQDYNSFLYRELETAALEEGMLERLEEEHEQLSHVETIIEQLSAAGQILSDEQMGLIPMLIQLRQIASKLSGFGEKYEQMHSRLESALIEFNDIDSEIQLLQEETEPNPQLLEEISNKLQHLYDLQKKHDVLNVAELIEIREDLSKKLEQTENLDDLIAVKESELLKSEKELRKMAGDLSERRIAVIPEFKAKLESLLSGLGMPFATFKIQIIPGQDFKSNGTDNLVFLFSANRGSDYGNLKKVASGGELSRIMLVIKSILADFEKLPTLMFDEIDSGVSGEMSNAMADIMLKMSKNMQLFSITHLPQVASKGQQHFKVYKVDEGSKTDTRIKLLDPEERIVELAEMLGGKSISDSALAHAKQLLN
ncbi:MAG: DNA repair protein RecN [Flavobacteriaceae bacterium]